MKKLLLTLVLVALVVMIAVPVVMAFHMPAVCEYAGYGPQWTWQCVVGIALELWMDPMDLLD